VNSNLPTTIGNEDGIDVVSIFRVMWRYRYLIVSAAVLFALIAVYLALTATEIYRAKIVVSEVRDNGLSGASGLVSQFGGLASLAGLNLANDGTGTYAQAVLRSRHLIETFIEQQRLVARLMGNAGKRATLWFAVQRFQETIVAIHVDTKTGLISVTMDWSDPVTAATWANAYVALANQRVRAHVAEDATRNVAYLDKQIAQTSAVEIQRSLYDLVESQTKTLMLANARRDYPFEVVDPAVPPEIRHSPKRTLMVLSGLVLGFFAGAVLAFGLDAFRRRKRIP